MTFVHFQLSNSQPLFLGNEPRNLDAKFRTRHEPFYSRGIRLSDRSSESNHDWLIVNCEGRIKAAMFSLSCMLSWLWARNPLTSFLSSQEIAPQVKMVLNLVQLGESLIFQTGQDVMAGNGVVLFGMSPGNPYFKSHVIEDYVQYLGKEERRIIVVVPQQPAEHTYRPLGSKDAVKRAKRNTSKLKSRCRRAIDKVCTENIIILSLINSWYFKKASKSTVKYPPKHLCLSLFFYSVKLTRTRCLSQAGYKLKLQLLIVFSCPSPRCRGDVF